MTRPLPARRCKRYKRRMAQRRFQDKVVVVTGASAGIGEALAVEAHARGAHVVLLARREDRVRDLARRLSTQGSRALGLRCDVCSDDDLARAYQLAAEEFGRVDAVVANAGFGVRGRLEELTVDDYRRQFETNVFGVIRTIQAALPWLKQTQGRIGVVGSTNGYVSLGGWSAYCMSKHAVRSLCASIKHELRPYGISVTHFAPGFVESEFRRVDNHGQIAASAVDPVPRWLAMPARKAAQQMLNALAAREEDVAITWHSRVAIGVERLAPAVVSGALRVGDSVVARFSKT